MAGKDPVLQEQVGIAGGPLGWAEGSEVRGSWIGILVLCLPAMCPGARSLTLQSLSLHWYMGDPNAHLSGWL